MTALAPDPAIALGLGADLGVRLLLAFATSPAREADLSPAEVDAHARLSTRARRDEWRLGRAALKAALRAVGDAERAEDTTAIAFPHARLSLTHSGSIAVAAASNDPRADGLGVDIEVERTPRVAMARFFLGDAEVAWVLAQPDDARPEHLLRLWTIKEAVFKADRANGAATLRDYRVVDPAAPRGEARRAGTRFTYATGRFEGATLAIAVHRVERETS